MISTLSPQAEIPNRPLLGPAERDSDKVVISRVDLRKLIETKDLMTGLVSVGLITHGMCQLTAGNRAFAIFDFVTAAMLSLNIVLPSIETQPYTNMTSSVQNA